MKKVIVSIIGARPNIMKMVPIYSELRKFKDRIRHIVINTGQHFDYNLTKIFFTNFRIKHPDINLNLGSSNDNANTGKIICALETEINRIQPDMVLLYGDINSTLAASIVCSKFINKGGKKLIVCHIESGLRSFDNSMPEEINRKVTDILSDYLFVSESSGIKNLLNQGISKKKIYYVGNTMIDSLKKILKLSDKSKMMTELCVTKRNYTLVTLHRPSNVDSYINFTKIIDILESLSGKYNNFNYIFPLHPRTRKMLKFHQLENRFYNIRDLIITDPLGYIDFIHLMSNAKYVLTDSGGVQEETTFLNVPCLTLRENTERPVTVKQGSNTICGLNKKIINRNIELIFKDKYKKATIPKYWDGNASYRIVKILNRLFN